ncbi:glycosyltransferase family 2 protein [Halorhabdus amylolytica]|uniref:glycosyltransferase family 2 protein n=1 Tax=Halorhabdus amylolytica TaxID=2559573 RepID=UPI0010A9ECB9|nr:glycosyltransferase family 2 protein [Halorhabdus amylolytica]
MRSEFVQYLIETFFPGIIILVIGMGVVFGFAFGVYTVLGLIGTVGYTPQTGEERAKNVKIAIPTIASNQVRDSLFTVLDDLTDKYGSYEIWVILDEGAELQSELMEYGGIKTLVVPDEYDSQARAKGRALQYFTENVVVEAPDYWYAFLDDDNLILDDDWLYEISAYEETEYKAMNPILLPREGKSAITYIADHIRYYDDLTVFRFFTGFVSSPYMGFHGELLTVRGDVLTEIGFDRESIVEDFSFAMECVESDVKCWQSSTRVSILSPHSFHDFLRQRRRWFLGCLQEMSNMITFIVVGSRLAIWAGGITASWIWSPFWVMGFGITLPLWATALIWTGTLYYLIVIVTGTYFREGLLSYTLIPLLPVYAFLEHLVPYYAAITQDDDFVVISK